MIHKNYDLILIEKSREMPLDLKNTDELLRAINFEKDKNNLIVIEPTHRLSHELSLSLEEASLIKKNTTNIVYTSENSFGRALIILDVILLALESRGYTITSNGNGLFVTIFNQRIRLKIEEKIKCERFTPSERNVKNLQITRQKTNQILHI